MVRQQAEAEREALALSQMKPVSPAISHATPPDAAPALPGKEAAFAATMPIQEPAALRETEPPALLDEQAPRRSGFHTAAQIGRSISFGLAGAMLGGGLGILAANYMQLPVGLAKVAIYGPAALLAGACAIASFYTKTAHE